MTTVHTLASGSSGNAILVCCGETRLLLDAGISCRRITVALGALGLAPGDLTAILLTHTHSDHIAGLRTLLKRDCPGIWASEAAARDLSDRLPECESRLHSFGRTDRFSFGACEVTAFPTSHDAPGACGFRLDTDAGSVGLLTDSGTVTNEARSVLPGVDLVLLEANHDVETLRCGPYPAYLKQRILGAQGHLSNACAAQFAVELAASGTSEVVLAHLSRENNTPAMAHRAVECALAAAGMQTALSVAPRDSLSEAHVVAGRSACKG